MTRLEEIAAQALANLKGDRYKLTLVVSKRAQDLANGATPLVELDEEITKFSDIALYEVAAGKIILESGLEGV